MPRKARIDNILNYSHIIVQGIEKSYIFEEKYFKKLYLSLLEKKLEDLDIDVLAYCVMDNHVHILLYSEKSNDVMKYMQKVNTGFARVYNRIKNRVGYVYRDRYYLQPIISEPQLYNCLVYIHRNPIKAKIVSKYEEYPYSSYNEYLNHQNLITDRSIELIFGTTNNYIKTFKKIHEDRIVDDIRDVCEYVDENIVITDFLKSVNKSLEEVKEDYVLFKKLMDRLKNEAGLSLRKMSVMFKIGRETLRKINNKDV